jgi:hypothetical protein
MWYSRREILMKKAVTVRCLASTNSEPVVLPCGVSCTACSPSVNIRSDDGWVDGGWESRLSRSAPCYTRACAGTLKLLIAQKSPINRRFFVLTTENEILYLYENFEFFSLERFVAVDWLIRGPSGRVWPAWERYHLISYSSYHIEKIFCVNL